jgi:hypothetical protein
MNAGMAPYAAGAKKPAANGDRRAIFENIYCTGLPIE